MPRLSLTDLVDIVSASGTPKATKVKVVKNRGDYHPSQDFYRPLRERIVEAHQAALGRPHVKGVLGTLSDGKKLSNYPDAVSGYVKWWGKKTPTWFDPPRELISASGVDVSVNPELGLVFSGAPHVIKLYFKGEQLTKRRTDIIVNTMHLGLSASAPSGAVMGVLDVRRSKLFTPSVPNPLVAAMVNAELAYVAALWPSV